MLNGTMDDCSIGKPPAEAPRETFGAGAYTLLRLLGRGGMGSVYLARQNSLGRDVAIKVLDVPDPSPALTARFLAEPRLMAEFPDPSASHIVPVLDCGTDPASGRPYYVMEALLLDSDAVASVSAALGARHAPPPPPDADPAAPRPLSLADFLRDGHTLSDASAARLALDVLPALEKLHAAGIVHRDVKPSNLLFSATGRLLLADFGIAKNLSADTASPTLSSLAASQPGTQRYAAPEQKSGLMAVPATDYYALGCVLFQVLTGGTPVAGSALPKDCPTPFRKRWQPLLDGLLEPDPVRRLHDPAAIANLLQGILRAANRREARFVRLRRHRALLAGLGAAALLAAVAAPLLLLARERHPAGTVRTLALPGGVALDLVWVPAGKFSAELPGRSCTVSVSRGFWLGRCEVTRAQWAAVMGTDPPPADEAALPVCRVSWADCTNFLARANALVEGPSLSLPSEAEWELAARGNAPRLDRVPGWHAGNSGRKLHAAGMLGPGVYDLHDMGGNVAEWCADWNATDRFGDATRVRDPSGPASGAERVCRGGSYLSAPQSIGSDARGAFFPDTRTPFLGFRVLAR